MIHPEAISDTLTEDAALLRRARAAARGGRGILGEFDALAGGDPRQRLARLGRLLSLPVLGTADMLAMGDALDLLPLSRAMQRHTALLRPPAEAGGPPLLGVVSDPFDADLLTWLETLTAGQGGLGVALALRSDVQAYLSKLEETARAMDNVVQADDTNRRDGRTAATLSFASVSEAASPAVKLVNSTLYDALKAGASDIHLESTAGGLAIKYRIDGVLDRGTSVSGTETAEQVISRLKVLAELDIAERRIPQDGSFRVEAAGREIDLRVSIMPSIHGEDAVIRILDKRAMMAAYGALSLETLGFDAASLATLRGLAEEPHGMLLVTGPTGSGKTTTLYAALTEIHNGRDKIITIEDPVEYQLPGILQIPVNERKGLTFAKGLRSILRHDPDKIMVGEIRDRETAEIAVQSALTGHLVLTTVHANNVFDVFGRFTHMGIDPYAFVSALNGIWAQRLIRVNCPHCATDYLADEAELLRLGLPLEGIAGHTFRRGAGCGDCRGTGYKGRRAIAEILTLTDELREMVVEKSPIRQIKEAAHRNGTRSLREAALVLARAGETTLAEVKRVTQHA
ncbi:GspE/PulE family protein [Nitrospirillum pindoramense]|uniref:General secretion pathway protein E n=1 Tax=Nitrospirillum amazonense TaxID=28077 RepID=A0A560H621_9PROT|nr:GspE/PulE family protein [Nitrospirillum amazonense]TWB41020.1 general secretion pathway protein E [Nitrospirillum amazonense]